MATRIRFYPDENMQVATADQLKRRGITVITARDLSTLGDADTSHLQRAANEGYVFCTHDADYVELATSGMQHAGIVLGQQDKHNIGIWVRFLVKLHADYTAEEMHNAVKYVRPL